MHKIKLPKKYNYSYICIVPCMISFGWSQKGSVKVKGGGVTPIEFKRKI